jgi:uncharacterized membrane protein YdbT with pleckstrin-like domain
MPSYVDNNLVRDEEVVYRARISWSVLISLRMIFIIPIVFALITYLTTEMAVTSRRVIAKRGFIRRTALDLNHARVESVQINQGIFGRIFNSGTVVIRGTGGTNSSFPGISNPMEFRRQALDQIDSRQ